MANHTGGGDCEYCKTHGLYDEFPRLKDTSKRHAIQTTEQGQLFDPSAFHDRRKASSYDPNAGAAINPGS